MPDLRERLGLAVRQSPIRGAVVVLLLVVALGFLVTTVLAFDLGQSLWILAVGVLIVGLVLGAIALGTWLSRRG